MPNGLNLVGWFSTQPDFLQGTREYPFYYHYMGDEAEYHIHSNCELTIKLCIAVAQYVNGSVEYAVEADKKRKVANR